MEYGAVKARIPVGIGPERIVIRQGMVDRIAVGRREGIDQLRIFDRREFVNALFGHETK